MGKDKNTDYRKYRLNPKECLVYGMIFLGCAVAGFHLLFNSIFAGLIAGAFLLPLFYYKLSLYLRDRRISLLEEEFCRYMQLTVAALSGGTSFENVFREVADSVSESEGESVMKREYYIIDRMISLNYDSREAFASFAQRSGSKDIMCIASALLCTSQSGGSVVNLLKSGVGALRLKQDTEREVKRIVSLPRMNHRILTAMPFAFVLLLKTMSPEYVNCLYVWPGRLAMMGAAVLLGASWLLGENLSKMRF